MHKLLLNVVSHTKFSIFEDPYVAYVRNKNVFELGSVIFTFLINVDALLIHPFENKKHVFGND